MSSTTLLGGVSSGKKEVTGWKQSAASLLDRLILSFPFVTEILNQGASKSLGLLAIWHFISRNHVEGDYLEFGVFRGETFRNSMMAAKQAFRGAQDPVFRGRFIAFDSFAGLPEVPSMKSANNVWEPGEFSASQAEFEQTIASTRKLYPVEIVPGWFNESLNVESFQKLRLTKAAFVNIDCDLYEATLDVLEWVLPILATGTVIYFDDWFSVKGSMDDGEPKACREWLAAHPEIKLVEYRNLGISGKAFIVNRVS